MRKIKLILFFAFFSLFAGTLRAQTTILDETLLTQNSFDTFSAVSVAGSQGWYLSTTYGAVCSGFSGGQTFQNEDWLISSALDLSAMDNVLLSFNHTRGNANVMNVGVTNGWYKAFATANYTGNPATTQWVELTGLNQNITTAWSYVSSGALTIPDAAKSANSRIAFRYMSSATQSATWEIKNVKVTGDPRNSGIDATFKITNWNTEWLGCVTNGPDDETLQINNVVAAIRAINSDIFCLQEVTNNTATPTIQNILTALGTEEWGGAIVPTNTGACMQRQAIIYKRAKVQLSGAFEISSGADAQGNSYYYNWTSGRYPALYTVNLIAGSNSVPLSLVNIHAKAEDGDAMSYTRRLGGSQSLKTILDSNNYNTRNLILIGDFNDYLLGTTSAACNCTVSPYKNFMDDTSRYTGITTGLVDNYVSWDPHPVIENIIISDELTDNLVANSVVRETSLPQIINNYYNTTSNHLPVTATFKFSTLGTDKIEKDAKLLLYPNPVKNQLYISNVNMLSDTTARIFDLAGRTLLTEKITENAVNVSHLPSGVYVVKVGNRSQKFIKD